MLNNNDNTAIWLNYDVNLPMTELGSDPKAQIQWAPTGTWKREKLHLELKYFGRNEAEAKLQFKRDENIENRRINSFNFYFSESLYT